MTFLEWARERDPAEIEGYRNYVVPFRKTMWGYLVVTARDEEDARESVAGEYYDEIDELIEWGDYELEVESCAAIVTQEEFNNG